MIPKLVGPLLRCRGRRSYLLVKPREEEGEGLENGRRKRATLPDGAEGPSRNREQGDERGWGGGS